MDQWTNGPMDQWSNGPMVQWSYGPMDQWTRLLVVYISSWDFFFGNKPNGPLRLTVLGGYLLVLKRKWCPLIWSLSSLSVGGNVCFSEGFSRRMDLKQLGSLSLHLLTIAEAELTFPLNSFLCRRSLSDMVIDDEVITQDDHTNWAFQVHSGLSKELTSSQPSPASPSTYQKW